MVTMLIPLNRTAFLTLSIIVTNVHHKLLKRKVVLFCFFPDQAKMGKVGNLIVEAGTCKCSVFFLADQLNQVISCVPIAHISKCYSPRQSDLSCLNLNFRSSSSTYS